MARTPKYKVYSESRGYIAACKCAGDAAALAALYGPGATIKLNHGRVVWREGFEKASAADSYDEAAEIIIARL